MTTYEQQCRDQEEAFEAQLPAEAIAVLLPIAKAISDDPGTSDLYNDQPVSITLGDVRKVWWVLRQYGVKW